MTASMKGLKKNLIVFFLSLLAASICTAQSNKSSLVTGYAPVNGLKMYYEIQGAGKPLVLLHGAYWSAQMSFGHLIPELSKNRQVITFDLQGHGRTADIDRPFSYQTLADDVAKALRYLKIEKADILGYSFGGTVALQLSIKNPELVNKLVIISTVFRYSGWLLEVRELLKTITPEMFEPTPIKTEYDRLAPDRGHWSTFVKKFASFDLEDYDLGAENIKGIQSPVLLIMGDNDGVDMAHKAEILKLLGGNIFADISGTPKSQLAILPGNGHVSLIMETNWLLTKIPEFLDAPVKTSRH